jgi:surface antigen Omp85-like protein
MTRHAAFFMVATLACGPTATAQETRAESLRQEREEKQRAVEPYEAGFLEKTLKALETGGVPLITRERIYVKLGSITTGSGFAYGLGYRRSRLLPGDGAIDVWAGATPKGYWAAEGRVRFTGLAGGRLVAEGYGRRHEYPQEDYFGLGPDSLRSSQSDYTLLSTIVGGLAGFKPASAVTIGGGLEYIAPSIGDGDDASLPSIRERFDDSTAPGLSQQPDFVRTSAFVEVDWRRPLNARRGGWYRADLSHYADRGMNAYTFNKLDIDLRQYISFFSERRVLVGRFAASTSDTASGQVMPFYFMHTLGGNDSLRGFRDYRFRGPHGLLIQGEYRFEIWSGLDGALFYDTGKVALRRGDLNLEDLESNYGFGFRFNTDNGVILRVDSAFGSRDGKHLWIVFGGTF